MTNVDQLVPSFTPYTFRDVPAQAFRYPVYGTTPGTFVSNLSLNYSLKNMASTFSDVNPNIEGKPAYTLFMFMGRVVTDIAKLHEPQNGASSGGLPKAISLFELIRQKREYGRAIVGIRRWIITRTPLDLANHVESALKKNAIEIARATVGGSARSSGNDGATDGSGGGSADAGPSQRKMKTVTYPQYDTHRLVSTAEQWNNIASIYLGDKRQMIIPSTPVSAAESPYNPVNMLCVHMLPKGGGGTSTALSAGLREIEKIDPRYLDASNYISLISPHEIPMENPGPWLDLSADVSGQTLMSMVNFPCIEDVFFLPMEYNIPAIIYHFTLPGLVDNHGMPYISLPIDPDIDTPETIATMTEYAKHPKNFVVQVQDAYHQQNPENTADDEETQGVEESIAEQHFQTRMYQLHQAIVSNMPPLSSYGVLAGKPLLEQLRLIFRREYDAIQFIYEKYPNLLIKKLERWHVNSMTRMLRELVSSVQSGMSEVDGVPLAFASTIGWYIENVGPGKKMAHVITPTVQMYPELDPLANYVLRFTATVRGPMKAYTNFMLDLLLWLSHLQSSERLPPTENGEERESVNAMGCNVLFTGEAGIGKTERLRRIEDQSIPGTMYEISHITPKALTGMAKWDGATVVFCDMPGSIFGVNGTTGQGTLDTSMIKSALTEGVVITYTLRILPNSQRVTDAIKTPIRMTVFGARNGSTHNDDVNVLSRFYRVIDSSDDNPEYPRADKMRSRGNDRHALAAWINEQQCQQFIITMWNLGRYMGILPEINHTASNIILRQFEKQMLRATKKDVFGSRRSRRLEILMNSLAMIRAIETMRSIAVSSMCKHRSFTMADLVEGYKFVVPGTQEAALAVSLTRDDFVNMTESDILRTIVVELAGAAIDGSPQEATATCPGSIHQLVMRPEDSTYVRDLDYFLIPETKTLEELSRMVSERQGQYSAGDIYTVLKKYVGRMIDKKERDAHGEVIPSTSATTLQIRAIRMLEPASTRQRQGQTAFGQVQTTTPTQGQGPPPTPNRQDQRAPPPTPYQQGQGAATQTATRGGSSSTGLSGGLLLARQQNEAGILIARDAVSNVVDFVQILRNAVCHNAVEHPRVLLLAIPYVPSHQSTGRTNHNRTPLTFPNVLTTITQTNDPNTKIIIQNPDIINHHDRNMIYARLNLMGLSTVSERSAMNRHAFMIFDKSPEVFAETEHLLKLGYRTGELSASNASIQACYSHEVLQKIMAYMREKMPNRIGLQYPQAHYHEMSLLFMLRKRIDAGTDLNGVVALSDICQHSRADGSLERQRPPVTAPAPIDTSVPAPKRGRSAESTDPSGNTMTDA